MTATIWALASALDLVPMPPNQRLAQQLAGWWSRPRLIACDGARQPGAPWVVVSPDPVVVCGTCAAGKFAEEARCTYCHAPVVEGDQVELLFEMRGSITVLGRAHEICHEGEA